MALWFDQARCDRAIQRGAQRDDIDDSFLMAEIAIGQDDGGPADIFLSDHGDRDSDEWRDAWPTLTVEERAAVLRAYIDWERSRVAVERRSLTDAARPLAQLVEFFSGGDDAAFSVKAGELRRLAAALKEFKEGA